MDRGLPNPTKPMYGEFEGAPASHLGVTKEEPEKKQNQVWSKIKESD
jgi:hypothetical protein